MSKPARSGSLALAFVGALTGAFIGALIWGIIAVMTGRTFGLIALLVGAIVGGLAKLFGRGTGVPYQLVGGLSTLAGVVLAKYFSIAGIVVQTANEGGGQLGYFDAEVMEMFWPAVQLTSPMPGGLFEIAWAFGGAYIAWSMLSTSAD